MICFGDPKVIVRAREDCVRASLGAFMTIALNMNRAKETKGGLLNEIVAMTVEITKHRS